MRTVGRRAHDVRAGLSIWCRKSPALGVSAETRSDTWPACWCEPAVAVKEGLTLTGWPAGWPPLRRVRMWRSSACHNSGRRSPRNHHPVVETGRRPISIDDLGSPPTKSTQRSPATAGFPAIRVAVATPVATGVPLAVITDTADEPLAADDAPVPRRLRALSPQADGALAPPGGPPPTSGSRARPGRTATASCRLLSAAC
jgi:hypothetical protein